MMELYGFVFSGHVLDHCDAKFIPKNAVNDMHSILCYDYEGGKPWHDNSVVMEIHFWNYQPEIEDNKIRILYDTASTLMSDFYNLTKDCLWNIVSVRMDLSCNICCQDRKDEKIDMTDFEYYDCRIRHKIVAGNPELPDD
ncbi:MAG: hypothetical protein MJ178_01900 [Treponemataceae bacterium]|nr:hypothetical protein [Treponemataceae bacterium]